MKLRFFYIVFFIFIALPSLVAADSYDVSRVVIEGNQRLEKSSVLSVISAKAGSKITTDDIDSDLAAIFKLGRFDDVTAEIIDQDGETLLIYRLVERPLVRKVKFEGNEALAKSKLSPLVTIKIPDLYNPKIAAESIKAIKAAYIEKGYHAAAIEPILDVNNNNEATVTFRIDEGAKVLIDNINFDGNTVFSSRKLRKSIQTQERTFMSWLTDTGTYSEEILQTDLEIIKDMYFNEGYVQIKVKQPYVALVKNDKYLDVFIQIIEGNQFEVGDVSVDGDLIADEKILLGLSSLQETDTFSRKGLRDSMLALNNFYTDRGYAYVNVAPLTSTVPGKNRINIKFHIEKGVEVAIGRIDIRGNTKSLDKVIRRELVLAEGDLYSAKGLDESRRRINNLGFFEEININTSKGADEKIMDVNIDVKEKPTGTFSIGMGYSSIDKLIAQGSVSQANFLGRGYKLNLSGSFGGSSTVYQIGLLDPYFLDKNLSLGFDLYNTEREWTEYTELKTGGDIKLGFPVTRNTRVFLIYRYEEKDITEIDPFASSLIKDQEGESTLSSIFASLSRNTTDYHQDPSRGSKSEVSIEYAGIGGDEKFARAIIDHRHFFPVFWGTVFSIHGQIGQAFEIGNEEIPIGERFYLGGIRTIRGFKTRQVGPRVKRFASTVDPVTGVVVSTVEDYEYVGGEKEAYFNFEYLFPIVKDAGLKGVLFFDTGNAWLKSEDFFESMRYSVGGGIRWLSPLGPLRLEWGRNLDPLQDERDTEIEFSIGRFF